MGDLKRGNVKINVAEFIAALITCETFTSFCSGKFTTIEIDNISAKSWLDSARCPKFPFDRCAQGVHLHKLKNTMKIKTSWIPSKKNVFADIFSRKRFPKNQGGHLMSGISILKVKPRWSSLVKFL